MSHAFVKEPDGDETVGELPDLPISPHPNFVTPAGLATLKQRLLAFEEERDGLLAAGADLVSRPALAHAEREIRYLKARIESAIPVDPAGQPRDRVAFGARVKVVDGDDKEQSFQIVGEDEAEPAKGRVSWVSPLAQALRDGAVGDAITWRRPSGDVDLEILAIEYPE